MEKRLHILVQRGLDVPPIAPPKRRVDTRAAEQENSISQQPESLLEQDTQEPWSQDALQSQQLEPALEQDSFGPWSQGAFPEESQPINGISDDEGQLPPDGLLYMQRIYHARQQQFTGIPLQPRQERFPGVQLEPQQQQQFGGFELELPNSWQYSQQLGNEWLDLSQARYIMDENGKRITFEDLDDEEYSYELIPLGSDDLPVPG